MNDGGNWSCIVDLFLFARCIIGGGIGGVWFVSLLGRQAGARGNMHLLGFH